MIEFLFKHWLALSIIGGVLLTVGMGWAVWPSWSTR